MKLLESPRFSFLHKFNAIKKNKWNHTFYRFFRALSNEEIKNSKKKFLACWKWSCREKNRQKNTTLHQGVTFKPLQAVSLMSELYKCVFKIVFCLIRCPKMTSEMVRFIVRQGSTVYPLNAFFDPDEKLCFQYLRRSKKLIDCCVIHEHYRLHVQILGLYTKFRSHLRIYPGFANSM